MDPLEPLASYPEDEEVYPEAVEPEPEPPAGSSLETPEEGYTPDYYIRRMADGVPVTREELDYVASDNPEFPIDPEVMLLAHDRDAPDTDVEVYNEAKMHRHLFNLLQGFGESVSNPENFIEDFERKSLASGAMTKEQVMAIAMDRQRLILDQIQARDLPEEFAGLPPDEMLSELKARMSSAIREKELREEERLERMLGNNAAAAELAFERGRIKRTLKALEAMDPADALAFARAYTDLANVKRGLAGTQDIISLALNSRMLAESNRNKIRSGIPVIPEVDALLAETWHRYPFLRRENGGSNGTSISKYDFSKEAGLKYINQGQVLTEALNFVGRPFRATAIGVGEIINAYKTGSTAAIRSTLGTDVLFGDPIEGPMHPEGMSAEDKRQRGDMLLHTIGAAGYEYPGVWIAKLAPEVVDFVAENLISGSALEGTPQQNREIAEGAVAFFSEISSDPTIYFGLGARNAARQGMRQVSKAVVRASEGARPFPLTAKEARKVLRKSAKGRMPGTAQEWQYQPFFEDAWKELRNADSMWDAHDKIEKLLVDNFGPESAKFLMQKNSFGKAGLVLTFPIMDDVLELIPHSKFQAAKDWTQDHLWMNRRLFARKFLINHKDPLQKTFALKLYEGVLQGTDELIKRAVTPTARYTRGKQLDWLADWAGNRLLDKPLGPPIEAVGEISQTAVRLQREVAQAEEAIKLARKAGNADEVTQLKASLEDLEKQLIAQQDAAKGKPSSEALEGAKARRYLASLLGDVVGAPTPGHRVKAISRFNRQAKIVAPDIDWDDALRVELDELARGKWPAYFKEVAENSPHLVNPRTVIGGLLANEQEFRRVVSQHEAFLDGLNRAVANFARGISKEFGEMKYFGGQHFVPTKGVAAGQKVTHIDPKKVAGELAATQATEKFRDFQVSGGKIRSADQKDITDDIIRQLDDETSEESYWQFMDRDQKVQTVGLFRIMQDQWEELAKAELALGIDLNARRNYFTSVYENLDFVRAEQGASVGVGGKGFKQKKQLSMAQAMSMMLDPETDILKMMVARRLGHNRAVQEAMLKQAVAGKFGRDITDFGDEVAAGVMSGFESTMTAVVQGAAGNEARVFALPKYAAEAIDEVLGLLHDPAHGSRGFLADVNNFYRMQLTAPNPGFHVRNAITNAIFAWMAGVRHPERASQALMAMMAPSSLDNVQDIMAQARKITDPNKRRLATKLADKKIQFADWLRRQRLPQVGNENGIAMGELIDEMTDHAVVSKGYFKGDLQSGTSAEIDYITKTGPLVRAIRAAKSPEAMKEIAEASANLTRSIMKPDLAVGVTAGTYSAMEEPGSLSDKAGAFGTSFAAGIAGGALATSAAGLGIKALNRMPKINIPFSMNDKSVLLKMGTWTGEKLENHTRAMVYLDQRMKGVPAGSAAAHVDKFLYNYRSLTNFDKSAREAMLFWTWTRNNIPRMLEELAQRPGRLSMLGHSKRMFESGLAGELMRDMPGAKKDAWKGVAGESLPRYYSRMWGWKAPFTTKTGKPVMIAFDWPQRDLNTLTGASILPGVPSSHGEAFKEDVVNWMGMISPVFEHGINLALQGAGMGWLQPGRRKGMGRPGHSVVAPGWIQNLPKPVMDYAVSKGIIDRRPSEFAKYKDEETGEWVIPDVPHIKEEALYWLNETPMLSMLSRTTGIHMDYADQQRLSMISYLFGLRAFAYDDSQDYIRSVTGLENRYKEMARRQHPLGAVSKPTGGIPKSDWTMQQSKADIAAGKSAAKAEHEEAMRKLMLQKLPEDR